MKTKQDCTDILKNIWTEKGARRAVFCMPVLYTFAVIEMVLLTVINVMERIDIKIMEWIEE
jgi:hypothetical protein